MWSGLTKILYTVYRNRLRLHVTAGFSSADWIGHSVRLRNLGIEPVVINAWQIESGWLRRWRTVLMSSGEVYQGDLSDTVVGPRGGTHAFEFAKMYYFPMPKGRTYLRMWVAGRRRTVVRRLL